MEIQVQEVDEPLAVLDSFPENTILRLLSNNRAVQRIGGRWAYVGVNGWLRPEAVIEAGYVVMAPAAAAEPAVPVPEGLCGNREDHDPHLVEFAPVANGPLWCHADQSRRLPYALERRP